jgi:hypothetical protein
VVESTDQPNSSDGQSAVVLDSPAPEAVTDPPLPENVEQAKTKPVSIEKTVSKKEPVEEPTPKTETVEKPKPEVEAEAPRPVPQTARRTETPRRNQASTRRESEPVPDIESIFTGRPSGQRSERGERREQIRRIPPEDMSEEEYREWRRQRREERRRRQYRNTFPF